MSRIDKVYIQGIRSFSPEVAQTVIVGHNGAGKTSIIEALKYATTGELPPNAKGAFVFDPKLAERNQVVGSVGLKFHDANGREMRVNRSASVTLTAKSSTFKTLDCSILFKKNNLEDLMVLSKRVAEIDAMVPQFLGVSKSVLENVIFCHQEDSLWPMSEPAALKKRFDDIFSATGYSKALLSIKSLKKEWTEVLKLQQIELKHTKLAKEKAARVKKDRLEVQDKIGRAQSRLNALDQAEIARVVDQMNALMDKQREWNTHLNKISQISLEKDMIVSQISALQSAITVMAESMADLEKIKRDTQGSLSSREAQVRAFESQQNSLNTQMESCQASLSEKLTLIGKLCSEKEMLEFNIHELEIVFDELNIGELLGSKPDSFWQVSNTPQILSCYDERVAYLNTQLSEFQNSGTLQLRGFQSQYQDLQTSLTQTKELKRNMLANLQSSNAKSSELLQKIRGISVTENEIRRLTEDLDEKRHQVNQTQTQQSTASSQTQHEDWIHRRNELESQISNLNGVAAKLHQWGQVRTRAELLQTSVDSKSREMSVKMDSIRPSIEKTVGPVSDWQHTLGLLSRSLVQKKSTHQTIVIQLSQNQKKANGLSEQLKLMKSQVNEKQTFRDSIQAKIVELFGDVDFHEALNSHDQVVEDLSKTLASMQSAEGTYKKFINKYLGNECCPLCDRSFQDPAQGDAFLEKLETILSRVPEASSKTLRLFNDAEGKRKQFRDLAPEVGNMERVCLEIPGLASQIKTVEDQGAVLERSLVDTEAEANSYLAEASALESLIRETENVVRLEGEKKTLATELEQVQSRLRSSGVTQSLDSVQSEIESCQAELQRVRASIQTSDEHMRDIQATLVQQNKIILECQTQLATATTEFAKKKELEREMVQEQEKRIAFEESIVAAKAQESELNPKLYQLENSTRVFQDDLDSKVKSKQALVKSLEDSRARIQRIYTTISRSQSSSLSQRLSQAESERDGLNAQLVQSQTALGNIRAQIQAQQAQTAQVQVKLRQIEDNVKLRELHAKDLEIKDKIDQMKVRSASFRHKSLATEYDTLKKQHETLVGERAMLLGELKPLEEQCAKIDRELGTEYKDVDYQYAQQLIEATTQEIANADLEKYGTALDQAIMKFHSVKMEEINQTLAHLWDSVYNGVDIDTIALRADVDKKVSGNRSYNYRIVMIKNNVEMDMRGRCSAGQKVLCSILIRLALAETFCAHSGLLALDEPTTNLDHDNVTNLSRALRTIIDERSHQSNFQLIVITHDEEFVQALGQSQYCDHLYRVAKDEDGYSTIERQGIGKKSRK